MEIRKNLILSVILHLMIIPIALAVNSRVTTHRAPADFIIISLSDKSEGTGHLAVQGRDKDSENVTKGIWKKDISPVFNSIKEESAGDLFPDQNDTYSSGINSLTSSSMSSTTAEERLSQQNAHIKNVDHLPSNAGNTDISKTIHAAIEKALIYPLLAKRRGIEGTVTAEFSINSRGYPENIKILRSSGYEILDSSARDTVIKASPFPAVKGNVEIPITFRLKKDN